MIKKSTINDVAALSGFSITTVSRVINGNYPVKEETRAKIYEAIKELDFKPNDIAVSMVKKKTNTIGVVIPSVTNIFFSTLVKGINDVLTNSGYTMLLCTSNNDEEVLVNNLCNRQVDGIIVVDSNISNKKEFYNKIHNEKPLIFINGYDSSFNNVSSNQQQGTIDALNYFKKQGKKNILFVRGNEDSYSYNLKEEIFLQNIENPQTLVVKGGNSDHVITNTTSAIIDFFSNSPKVDAIFACNDLMAIGVLEALKQLNISVPNDIAVIGFDNIFLCTLVSPKLTTVDQDIYNLGKISCENILKIMSKRCKVDIRTDCNLVFRESS